MIPLMLEEVVRVMRGRPSSALPPVSVNGVSTDSRTCGAGELFFAIKGARFDGFAFVDDALGRGAVAAVVEGRPVPDDRPLVYVGDVVGAMGRLAAFHRQQRSVALIAVTGSNGKTTVKSMIDHVLSRHLHGRAAERSFNNALGVPLTLLAAEAHDDYLVAEIGSNAKGEVSALARLASPNIGVVTSIGDAHLAGFGDRGGVAREKGALIEHIRPGGLAVITPELARLAAMTCKRSDITYITFGDGGDADVCVSEVVSTLDAVCFRVNGRVDFHLAVPGRHNAYNAAAAFAVCRRMKIDAEVIAEALSDFRLGPMRLNVERMGEMTLIDDSYNANPTSTAAALEVLRCANGGRRVVVAGEMRELGCEARAWHEEAGRTIAAAGAELVVGVGDHAPDVIRGAQRAAPRTQALLYATTEAACDDLPGRLRATDTVLIKGSRGLQLDRLARRVRNVFGR